ncbi:MAG: DUF4340 domain-containing protein [Candidatus Aureabacteria bacterium]|nr:DUF4340 domain-containing protein [Candidatus Auribacterota bacterium]
MPKRLTVVLILLGLVILYLLLVESRLTTTDERIKNKNTALQFPENSLQEISFSGITLEKYGDLFRLKKPFSHPASNKACMRLFTQFEKVIRVNVFPNWRENDRTLADFGLDSPAWTVTLKSKNQANVIKIGKKVEGQEEYYAQLDAEPSVFTVKESLVNELSKNPAAYADTEPFDFLKEQPSEVKWFMPGRGTFLRHMHGLYVVGDHQGRIWQALKKRSEAFITLLTRLDLSELHLTPISDEESGVASPWCYVYARGPNQKSKSLLIGSEHNGKRWAKLEKDGMGFELDSNLLEVFNLDFEQLAAGNLLEGEIMTLEKAVFHFSSSDTSLVLKGRKNEWTMEHPYAWLFSSRRILNLVLRFAVREVLSFENRTLSNPFLTVTFHYEDDPDKSEKVELFTDKNQPDLCFAQRNGSSTAGAMKAVSEDEFPEDPFYFMMEKPFSAVMDKTTRIEIQKQEKSSILQQNERGVWNFEKNELPVNTEPAQFIEALKNSTCRTAMSRKEGVDFGFTDPSYVVKFYDDEGKSFFMVRVGSYSTSKETYLEGDDAVFMFMRDFPQME